jgi:hypothetical protein
LEDRRITVVLASMPRLLHDLVKETVEAQPDLELVGEIDEPVLDDCPDFLVVGVETEELPEAYRELLFACPRMEVVAVTEEARLGFLYELRPQATPLGEISPTVLLEALRPGSRGN